MVFASAACYSRVRRTRISASGCRNLRQSQFKPANPRLCILTLSPLRLSHGQTERNESTAPTGSPLRDVRRYTTLLHLEFSPQHMRLLKPSQTFTAYKTNVINFLWSEYSPTGGFSILDEKTRYKIDLPLPSLGTRPSTR